MWTSILRSDRRRAGTWWTRNGSDAFERHKPMSKESPDLKVLELYALAKGGGWPAVLDAFNVDGKLAGKCSRFVRETSGWTFLHQAAYFGEVAAVRALIAR